MTDLKTRRRSLGLSQTQVAELLGTRQPNISAYEKGMLEPGRMLRERIEAFTRLEPDSATSDGASSTLAGYAQLIKQALRNDDQDLVTRLIVQASDDFRSLDSQADIDFFLCEPSTTGDRNYDALLAGLAVHLAREARAAKTPTWTTDSKRYLQSLWYFGAAERIPNMRALAFRDALPSMRARGVIFSRRNLESV